MNITDDTMILEDMQLLFVPQVFDTRLPPGLTIGKET
jgi:hypothetical protein